MKFGVCTTLENLPVLKGAGYDYIELAVAGTLRPESPEGEIMPALIHQIEKSDLKAEAYNVLLPGDLKVVGETVDLTRQEYYLENAFARAAMLGGQVVVFGSGAARAIPDGFSREKAEGQIREFVVRCGDAAAKHGLSIAIEPLNTQECNVINSVGEALEIVKSIAHPAVGVLSDLYHITEESQTYEETRDAGTSLRHVHIAGAKDRRAPIADDEEFLRGYFRALKEIDYDARISIEGNWTEMAAQAPAALAVLRRAWAAA